MILEKETASDKLAILDVRARDDQGRWLNISFRFAPELSLAELAARLPDPIFREAAGVLEMISHTPQERELHEARLKLERDEAARLLGARQEGFAEGLAERRAEGRAKGREEGERIGKLIGVVQTLQQLLGIEVSPLDKLRAQSEEDLSLLAETLQSRLSDRGAS